jgi:MIP family channel proteins
VSDARARALGAEALGTSALVFFGCGAIVVDAERGGLGHVGVSLAFGLVVMAMVYAFGHVSGAHINPAVTLALASRGRFAWKAVPGYLGAQIAGAVLAAVFLRASLGDVANLGATQPSGSDGQSFVWEVLLTAVLLVVIVAVATDARAVAAGAAIAIGGTIALASLVGGPISGASLNPARSLGPALVSGELDSLWIYLIAPVLGGLLGALAYDAVRSNEGLDQPR